MEKAGKMVRFLLWAFICLAALCRIQPVKAEEMKNVEEQGGATVNVSKAFHQERYVNGYYFSNIALYIEDDIVYFTMTATNRAEIIRPLVYMQCVLLDESGKSIQYFDNVIDEVRPGESTLVVMRGIGEGIRVDAYDIMILFEEKDLLNPGKDTAINKEIICDKEEIIEGDDVILQSGEQGEQVTYQWFYAEEIAEEGVWIEAADSREYKLSHVSAADSGGYYYCRIWKEGRVANSKWFQIIVYGEKYIEIAVVGGKEAVAGKPFTLKAVFGFEPSGYQLEWYASDQDNLSEAEKLDGGEEFILITESREGGRYYWCIARRGETRPVISDAFYLEIKRMPEPQEDLPAKAVSAWQVQGLQARQLEKPVVKLAWEKCSAESIAVLRSVKKDSDYRAIGKLSGKRTTYTDKEVRRGKIYYYKVISFNGNVTEELFVCEAEIKRVMVDYLMRPVITATKGTIGGQRYVQITLKQFQGEYVEIYMEGKAGYSRLKIKKGKNRTSRKKYRFRYARGNVRISFRVRTYRMVGRKKYYSRFSRVSRIRI